MAHHLIFAKDERGCNQVAEWLILLARRKVDKIFEATEILGLMDMLHVTGPQGQSERTIDGSIEIYALRHEDDVVAYANSRSTPALSETIVFLCGFKESEWDRGLDKAESIARL